MGKAEEEVVAVFYGRRVQRSPSLPGRRAADQGFSRHALVPGRKMEADVDA